MHVLRLAALICALPTASLALPWPEAIANAKTRVEALYQAGQAIGGLPNPGNHSINAIALVHQCAILGRMLDRADHVLPLEQITTPDPVAGMSEDDLYRVADGIKSLDIWINVAETMVSLSESDRADIWNNNCIGVGLVAEDGTVVIIPASAAVP